MTTDDPILRELASANPVPSATSAEAQDQAQAERVRHRVLSTPPRPREGRGILIPMVASALVVVVVAGAFLGLDGSSRHPSTSATDGGGQSVRIVLQARPTPQVPQVTSAAMRREVELLRQRMSGVVAHVTVIRSGKADIVIVAHHSSAATRSAILALVAQPAELTVYDWEANVLTPNGKTVAEQLAKGNPAALTISQGRGGAAGTPGAGGMSLYPAVKLASKQPPAPVTATLSRHGTEYFLFGAAGSQACAVASRAYGVTARPGTRCYVAGPASSRAELRSEAPAGTRFAKTQILAVPQGTVVLKAVTSDVTAPIQLSDPSTRFFVLHDAVVLSGADITDPHVADSVSGQPEVAFGFTSLGGQRFRNITAQLAHRGTQVSSIGRTLNQHFAIALQGRLILIPEIDFNQYPDGLDPASGGAGVGIGLSRRAVGQLATELRFGALPLSLRLLSASP
jgi:SecD/SecF fusion protein